MLNNPKYSKNNNWMNILQFDPKLQNKIIKNFKKNNIQTKFVWLPNHQQVSYKYCEKFNIRNLDKFFKGAICLPSSVNLKKKDIFRVVNILKNL